MAVNHQANLIKAFFGDGEQWGVQIDYSLESQPLSTDRAAALIDDLPDTFLLMNGDVLTDLGFAQSSHRQHVEQRRRLHRRGARRTQTIDYGVLEGRCRPTR